MNRGKDVSHMGIPVKDKCRKIINGVNHVVDLMVLTAIMLLIVFAGYALWDANQILHAADKTNYSIYKPEAGGTGKTFKELQAINPEVISWLTVYGTSIDYPVAQGTNNLKYVNTNAEGMYALSGAIFLDSANSKDFSDFNSILYGHHMEKHMMFGEIGDFTDKNMFDTHQYGNLYFDEKDHGIEFFAFVHTSAYDFSVFKPNVKGEGERQAYLDNLLEKAMHTRDIGITANDRLILLSTCSSGSTNGRDLLVGRITGKPFYQTGGRNQ
jgi:sortase B